jgi:hypothetical protein
MNSAKFKFCCSVYYSNDTSSYGENFSLTFFRERKREMSSSAHERNGKPQEEGRGEEVS